MAKKVWLSINETLIELSKKDIITNKTTLMSWILTHELGEKPDGKKWRVDRKKLLEFINSHFKTQKVYVKNS